MWAQRPGVTKQHVLWNLPPRLSLVCVMEKAGTVTDFLLGEIGPSLEVGVGQVQGPSKVYAWELRLKSWGLGWNHLSVNLPFILPPWK